MTVRVLFGLTSHDDLGGTGRKTGFYVPEVAHPAVVFRAAGYQIEYASVRGGAAPKDGIKPGDTVVADFLADPAESAALAGTRPFAEIDPADYDVVFFAGGHGTMWDFPDDPDLARTAVGVYQNGGVVAAVCHGPAALVELRLADGSYLVDGKEVSSFTDSEEHAVGLAEVVPFLLESRLAERGAKITKGPDFASHAVADGRLVTGQNPASAARVAELVVEALEQRDEEAAQ